MVLGMLGLFTLLLVAITRIVFFGLVLAGLIGVISIVLGIASKSKTKTGITGKRQSHVGISIGALLLLVAIVVIGLYAYGWSKFGEGGDNGKPVEVIFEESRVVEKNDYEIINEKVEVADDAFPAKTVNGEINLKLVTYESELKYKSLEKRDFVVAVKCTGDQGDREEEYDLVTVLDTDADTEPTGLISAAFEFHQDTISAQCEITSVRDAGDIKD